MASLRARGSLRRAILILVRLCEGGTFGVRVDELVRELGVSTATVYRDLKDLERVGLVLERVERDGERRICLPTPGRKPSLRLDERTRRALVLLKDGLAALEGTFVEEALNGLLGGSSGATRAPLRKTGPSGNAVDVIARGLEKRQRICFYYRGEKDDVATERTVEPLELRVIKDQLYLDAWCTEGDALRTFKPARMTRVRVLPEPCKKREVDLAIRRAGSVRVWDGELVSVCVRLSAAKARFASEWPLHSGQVIESQPDGSVLVHARVAGVTEASSWVLSWGAGAEAIEPAGLREAVRQELVGALEGYGVGSGRLRVPRGARGGKR